jgi:tyrosyl-tRNA synthetase
MSQVQANAKTYMEQFFKIVDKGRTEVRWQSEWFGKFGLSDIFHLTSRFTVAQLLAREDFSARYGAGRPIAMTELLYPLLQAYDSVAVQADVEFGGTDQKFNFLVGRELQSMVGQRPQQCFMTSLLVGTDGVQKMSKSLRNYIGVAEPPEEMYGKVMSIPDSLILQYFELLTDVPDKELEAFRQALNDDTVNPMVLKKRLASEIVTQLYDQKVASEAEKQFEKVHQRQELPDNIRERGISFSKFTFEREGIKYIYYNQLLVETGLAESRSKANQLIAQAGTTLAGKTVTSRVIPVEMVPSGTVITVGKRHILRVVNDDVDTDKAARATRPP